MKFPIDGAGGAALKTRKRSKKKENATRPACDSGRMASRKLARRSSGGQRRNVSQSRLESQRVTIKRRPLSGGPVEKMTETVQFREQPSSVKRLQVFAEFSGIECDQALYRLAFRLGLEAMEGLRECGVRIQP